MRLLHVRPTPPSQVWARCSALARSAISWGRAGLVSPQHPRLRDSRPGGVSTTPGRLSHRVAACLVLVTALTLAMGTVANAATAAKPTGPVVVRVQLRKPGVYEVRVTVSSRSALKNHV